MCHRNFIVADRQPGKTEAALFVGCRAEMLIGLLLHGGYGGARDHSARGILDGTADDGRRLAPYEAGKGECDDEAEA